MKNYMIWVATNLSAVAAMSWCLTEYHDVSGSVILLAAWCRCVFAAAAVVGLFIALDRWTEGGQA